MESSSAYQSLNPESTGTSLIYFRPPVIEDLDRVHSLEATSYPVDEAATYEKLKFRIESACNVFLLAIDSGSDQIIGFTCGTCTSAPTLTHESMSTHDPDGKLLCIHSVVVAHEHRRKGLASRMLKAYIAYVQGTTPDLAEIRLISKEQLVKLYQGVGFKLIGPSDVVHGADKWFELAYSLQQE
mmetsp:Transcript_2552/g.5685  ORF Transcript_2552/g.5685 Transcript_2552/m.5685 type:complete len:184 (-) Transcript_2552:144-695(-)